MIFAAAPHDIGINPTMDDHLSIIPTTEKSGELTVQGSVTINIWTLLDGIYPITDDESVGIGIDVDGGSCLSGFIRHGDVVDYHFGSQCALGTAQPRRIDVVYVRCADGISCASADAVLDIGKCNARSREKDDVLKLAPIVPSKIGSGVFLHMLQIAPVSIRVDLDLGDRIAVDLPTHAVIHLRAVRVPVTVSRIVLDDVAGVERGTGNRRGREHSVGDGSRGGELPAHEDLGRTRNLICIRSVGVDGIPPLVLELPRLGVVLGGDDRSVIGDRLAHVSDVGGHSRCR